jgi:hypothetical protein
MHLDLMHTYSRQRVTDLLEAAAARLGAVPLCLDEGGDGDQRWWARLSASCRPARGRPRRAAARRLLLRPDHADLVGAVCRRFHVGVLVYAVGWIGAWVNRRMAREAGMTA